MVRDGYFDWGAFQKRLVLELSNRETCGSDDAEIERHYFESWLDAAEHTLCERGFLRRDEVGIQIEAIRISVSEIRERQLDAGRA